MFNYCSSTFYVLGANVYNTYLTKYIEVQFNKTAAAATIFTGPISIVGTMIGFLTSGYIMTKYKIHARKLYFWCVICGASSIVARTLFMQLSCEHSNSLALNDTWLEPTECNAHCNCKNVAYNPVCDPMSKKTFFSACHAGCETYDAHEKSFSNCSCDSSFNLESPPTELDVTFTTGICAGNCDKAYIVFTIVLLASNLLGSTGLISNLMLNFR